MEGFEFQKLLEEKNRKGNWLVLEVVVVEAVVVDAVVVDAVVLEDVVLDEVVLEEDVAEAEAAVDVEPVLVVVDFDWVVVDDCSESVTSSPEPGRLPTWLGDPPLPLVVATGRSSTLAIRAWSNGPVRAPPRVCLRLGVEQCLPLRRFPGLVARHS